MKITLILMAGAAIAGCAQQTQNGSFLSRIQHECGAGLKTFVESWPCVRVGFSEANVSPDLKATFFATGDLVAERVRAGEMTDAEAKLVMAKARQEAKSIEGQRDADQARRQQSAGAMMLYYATRQQPAPVYTLPVITNPTTTDCRRFGNNISCTTY